MVRHIANYIVIVSYMNQLMMHYILISFNLIMNYYYYDCYYYYYYFYGYYKYYEYYEYYEYYCYCYYEYPDMNYLKILLITFIDFINLYYIYFEDYYCYWYYFMHSCYLFKINWFDILLFCYALFNWSRMTDVDTIIIHIVFIFTINIIYIIDHIITIVNIFNSIQFQLINPSA